MLFRSLGPEALETNRGRKVRAGFLTLVKPTYEPTAYVRYEVSMCPETCRIFRHNRAARPLVVAGSILTLDPRVMQQST